jgi:hypothetical protein
MQHRTRGRPFKQESVDRCKHLLPQGATVEITLLQQSIVLPGRVNRSVDAVR